MHHDRVTADLNPPPAAGAIPVSRRGFLALGAGAALSSCLGPRARAATGELRLLAPAAYADKALLAALAGNGPGLSVLPMEDDDQALAQLRPLPPTAGAAERAARPALVVTAHAFTRGILWPEGVVEPLAKDDPGKATPTNIIPAIIPTTATLETGFEGRYRVGVATRFDLAAIAIDQRRISVDAVGDLGLGLLDDPALLGRYGLLDDPHSLLATAMLHAGLDPLRLQLPSELRRFDAAVSRLVEQAAMISPSPEALVAAMAEGAIDAALPLGLRHIARARLDGQGQVRLAVPHHGPMAGRAAFYSIEMMSLAVQPSPLAAAAEVMKRLPGGPVTAALVRAGGGLAPAVGLMAPEHAGLISAVERQALMLDELPALMPHAVPLGLIPERRRLQPVLAAALAGK